MKSKKIRIRQFCLAVICAAMALTAGRIQAQAGQVASPDETVAARQVLEEGMTPVGAADIRNGVYAVEVESSSSMFRIVEAQLTVEDGEMHAVLTLSGKGYGKLYMGTGEEAVADNGKNAIEYVENEEGAYTYEIPVKALDAAIDCAAFSTKKEKWYDRELVFRADSLPDGTILTRPAAVQWKDGDYEIAVRLEGGSGKATVESPAQMRVENGAAFVTLVWSSPNYDYMRLGSSMYTPINTEGNSAFEIPVTVFDGEMEVWADTTAMGTPHEIGYELHLDSGSVKRAGVGRVTAVAVAVVAVLCLGIATVLCLRKRWYKKRHIMSILLLICVLTACGSPRSGADFNSRGGQPGAAAPGAAAQSGMDAVNREISEELSYSHSLELDYAREFSVDYYEGDYALISIVNGGRFLLLPEGGTAPDDLEENITVLQGPMSDIYLVASAVMDMFRAIDALDTICLSGLAQDAWYIQEARTAMEQGKIEYAGKYSAPDYELIMSRGCRLSIQSTMVERVPEVKEQLELLGVPVLVDRSSYEEHPLGRSEWVKLYGVLTGHEAQAKEAFDLQKKAFENGFSERELGKTVAFFYITAGGTVNVRKSGDYIPQMIALAGGTYVFENLQEEDSASGTMNLQMEDFYDQAKDADFLIYSSSIEGEIYSVEELLEKCPLLADFRAVQEGNVWCTTANLYQSSMELGTVTEDFHKMLTAEETEDGACTYLFRLEESIME